ncbi:sugarporin [Pycnococcus provasolii]
MPSSVHECALLAKKGAMEINLHISTSGLILEERKTKKKLGDFTLMRIVKWLPSNKRSGNPGPEDCLDIVIQNNEQTPLRIKCRDVNHVKEVQQAIEVVVKELLAERKKEQDKNKFKSAATKINNMDNLGRDNKPKPPPPPGKKPPPAPPPPAPAPKPPPPAPTPAPANNDAAMSPALADKLATLEKRLDDAEARAKSAESRLAASGPSGRTDGSDGAITVAGFEGIEGELRKAQGFAARMREALSERDRRMISLENQLAEETRRADKGVAQVKFLEHERRKLTERVRDLERKVATSIAFEHGVASSMTSYMLRSLHADSAYDSGALVPVDRDPLARTPPRAPSLSHLRRKASRETLPGWGM